MRLVFNLLVAHFIVINIIFSVYNSFENSILIKHIFYLKYILIFYTCEVIVSLLTKLLLNQIVILLLVHRLLYKWTVHGKSPSITTDPLNTLKKIN